MGIKRIRALLAELTEEVEALEAARRSGESFDETVLDVLRPSEKQVALLVAKGRTTKQVAEELGIAHRTADTHLGRIYKTLNIGSRFELMGLLRSGKSH